MSKIFPTRFALLKAYVGLFFIIIFIVRLSFLIWNFTEVGKNLFTLVNTFIIGFLFDIATISFFVIPYLIYLLLSPKRFYEVAGDFYRNKGLNIKSE